MALVIWIIVGLALWHLTIFVPDHFWGGIVGALVGSVLGAIVTGAIVQVLLGRSIGEADLVAFFAAIPGFLIGAWLTYYIGERKEDDDLLVQE